jgi:hypothetical protein
LSNQSNGAEQEEEKEIYMLCSLLGVPYSSDLIGYQQMSNLGL